MTIYKTILTRGYFPKELPPAFFTEQFARFATTKQGRDLLAQYKPSDSFTECARYRLALPGGERRELKIPHPASFASLARITARHFSRLLKKASGSPFAKSRPVYSDNKHRAIYPMMKPQNLARERAAIRAGSTVVLKADISHFYPSLYTHAVGWAIDPKLQVKQHWHNNKLLGKQGDQALMNLDGKISQGVPIGNDISYLLTEIVLAGVDKQLRLDKRRAFRWFDDYEIAFDSRAEAEACLRALTTALGRYRLRTNPTKTKIISLPEPVQDEWQARLVEASKASHRNAHDVVKFFDVAFRLRDQFKQSPVLLYAIAMLFSLKCPTTEVGRIAQSCITQAVLCEPGAAQKAFALLTFWSLNGFALDEHLLSSTISQIVLRHHSGGFTSDVSWGLAFCLDHGISVSHEAADVLSNFDDDCVAIQSLAMDRAGLLPSNFTKSRIARILKVADMDREHWLLAYEVVRHRFMSESEAAVKSNALFVELLKSRITFFRPKLPLYAAVVHSGGGPEWVVRQWLSTLLKGDGADARAKAIASGGHVIEMIEADLAALEKPPVNPEEAVTDLMDLFESEAFQASLADSEYVR